MLQITLKSSCYFVFSHSVPLCPNLYSTTHRSSLKTYSILVLVLSTELSWTAILIILEPPIILQHGPYRKHMSHVRLRVHCSISSIGGGTVNIENSASSIVECWTVYMEPLLCNVLTKSITLLYKFCMKAKSINSLKNYWLYKATVTNHKM
jgi:hypothetical protein